MLTSELITIRDFVPDDKPFILATWLKGLRYGNSWFLAIESKAYFNTYHSLLEALLQNPKTTVKIACLIEDPEVILGYVVFSGNRLDWIFIKKAWRSIGLSKKLLPEGIEVVTHLTEIGKTVLAKYPNVVFNPFLL